MFSNSRFPAIIDLFFLFFTTIISSMFLILSLMLFYDSKNETLLNGDYVILTSFLCLNIIEVVIGVMFMAKAKQRLKRFDLEMLEYKTPKFTYSICLSIIIPMYILSFFVIKIFG